MVLGLRHHLTIHIGWLPHAEVVDVGGRVRPSCGILITSKFAFLSTDTEEVINTDSVIRPCIHLASRHIDQIAGLCLNIFLKYIFSSRLILAVVENCAATDITFDVGTIIDRQFVPDRGHHAVKSFVTVVGFLVLRRARW